MDNVQKVNNCSVFLLIQIYFIQVKIYSLNKLLYQKILQQLCFNTGSITCICNKKLAIIYHVCI
jgi:hypothetical protein